MASRHKARVWALQILYRLDLNPDALDTAFDDFRHDVEVSEPAFAFTETLVRGVRDQLADLDQRIEHAADNWRVSRMGATERNILRMGAYELLYRPDVPPAAAIDQAIDLAKRFGSEESGKFVNGILDRLHHHREA